MNTLFNWDDCQSFAPDVKTLFENLNTNILGKQLRVSIENTLNPETKKTKSKIKVYYNVKEQLPTYVAPVRGEAPINLDNEPAKDPIFNNDPLVDAPIEEIKPEDVDAELPWEKEAKEKKTKKK